MKVFFNTSKNHFKKVMKKIIVIIMVITMITIINIRQEVPIPC